MKRSQEVLICPSQLQLRLAQIATPKPCGPAARGGPQCLPDFIQAMNVHGQFFER
jgi:hypothetical protein